MAASLSRGVFHRLRHFQAGVKPSALGQTVNFFHATARQDKSRSPDVCLSSDKSMVMCWHPEPDHPYEHTQPLPRDRTELEAGDSVLKVQYLVDEKLKNRPDGPTVIELKELFYTTKLEFKRAHRHEKKVNMRKFTPVDREGL